MSELPQLTQLACVDSTNELAFRELAAGRARHFDGWIAGAQTAGRGRRGSAWFGQPGDSLMMSVALVGQTSFSLPGPSLLSMAVALALIDAIGSRDVCVDWPNDLVTSRTELQRAGTIEAPKLAGILIEARDFNPAEPSFVVGVGVNVAGDLPEALLAERPACTLQQLGVIITPLKLGSAFQAALHNQVAAATSSPAAVCRAYLAATGLADREVTLKLGDQIRSGVLVDIVPDGIVLSQNGALVVSPLEHVQALCRTPIY